MAPTLYTYTARIDGGTAPNPYGPCCSLTICKPQIRQRAEVGDWVAGFGSRRSGCGDLHEHLIYAMRVTEKLTLREYDQRCRERRAYAIKIPDLEADDHRRHAGDALYDFSSGRVRQREGDHGPGDQARDLGGGFSLLSTDFIYFGREAPRVPTRFAGVVPVGRAYQSRLNVGYLEGFVAWLRESMERLPRVVGEPVDRDTVGCGPCGRQRKPRKRRCR